MKRTLNVAVHREAELAEGGTDLVRCGWARIEVIGFRPCWIGLVYKTITVGKRSQRWLYHETTPYLDRDKCRSACKSSIAAGERFAQLWDEADAETRARWASADRGRKPAGPVCAVQR